MIATICRADPSECAKRTKSSSTSTTGPAEGGAIQNKFRDPMEKTVNSGTAADSNIIHEDRCKIMAMQSRQHDVWLKFR